MGFNRVVTVREAARVVKRDPSTITRWIDAGYLHIVPRWGKEKGYRVLLSEVLEAASKPWRKRSRRPRCPKERLWYVRQIDKTRFGRLLETPGQRERRLKWQREYQRAYYRRKKGLKHSA